LRAEGEATHHRSSGYLDCFVAGLLAMTRLCGPINEVLLSPMASAGHRLFGLSWLVLLIFPFVAPNNYVVGLGALFCINAILIASLNLLMGFGGQISLSHAAFYGIGAYVSGVLSARFGLSPWLGIVAAILFASAGALIIGLPSLRLRGHYLAMATLGFNAIASVMFYELVPLTGGADGLSGIPSFTLFGVSLGNERRFFYFAWAVAGFLLLGMLNLIDSRVGRGLRALSTGELAANSMGVDTYRYKLQLFVLTAAMAAVAGALFAHYNNFVTPESFGFLPSVLMVVMVAVGGAGRFSGGILGAFILTVVPEALRSLDKLSAMLHLQIDVSAAEIFVFGVAMILVLLFLPQGLAGGVAAIRGRLGR
jgi:branched-chain amino acid transport system permease protein